MNITVDERGASRVAVVGGGGVVVKSVNDALDLMAEARHVHNCGKMLIDRYAFPQDFFDLSTMKLGEVLQKYTNYSFVVAITGSFDDMNSKSLDAFMLESNRKGDMVLFIPSKEEALDTLHKINP